MNHSHKARKQLRCGYKALAELIRMLHLTTNLTAETGSSLDSVLDQARTLLDNHLAAVDALARGHDVMECLSKRAELADRLKKSLSVLEALGAAANQQVSCETMTLRALLPAICKTVQAFVHSLYDLPRLNDEAVRRTRTYSHCS